MSAQNLEELLKEKTITITHPLLLFIIVLTESRNLRNEGKLYTVNQVLANNESWAGLEVHVLSENPNTNVLKDLRIVHDPNLKPDELKIIYYDPEEVKEF